MNSRRLTWSIASLFESLRVGSSVASGRLGRHVYRQKGHEEDQDGIKRDFSDVGSRTSPLLYSLPNHGGSPWDRKSHERIGAEAACHRTYGLVLGANLNCSGSGLGSDDVQVMPMPSTFLETVPTQKRAQGRSWVGLR